MWSNLPNFLDTNYPQLLIHFSFSNLSELSVRVSSRWVRKLGEASCVVYYDANWYEIDMRVWVFLLNASNSNLFVQILYFKLQLIGGKLIILSIKFTLLGDWITFWGVSSVVCCLGIKIRALGHLFCRKLSHIEVIVFFHNLAQFQSSISQQHIMHYQLFWV